MPSLDDLKKRIKSVKSTQKITKAMKMVAAAKLRKAQENAERGRPYSQKMQNIILNLTKSINDPQNAPKLLVGTGEDKKYWDNLFHNETYKFVKTIKYKSGIKNALMKELITVIKRGDIKILFFDWDCTLQTHDGPFPFTHKDLSNLWSGRDIIKELKS